jgi:hypothetical protein
VVSGRGGKKIAPLVGSVALRARVAELEDAEELDSSGSRGSCRFESCLGYASLQRRKFEFLTPRSAIGKTRPWQRLSYGAHLQRTV